MDYRLYPGDVWKHGLQVNHWYMGQEWGTTGCTISIVVFGLWGVEVAQLALLFWSEISDSDPVVEIAWWPVVHCDVVHFPNSLCFVFNGTILSALDASGFFFSTFRSGSRSSEVSAEGGGYTRKGCGGWRRTHASAERWQGTFEQEQQIREYDFFCNSFQSIFTYI